MSCEIWDLPIKKCISEGYKPAAWVTNTWEQMELVLELIQVVNCFLVDLTMKLEPAEYVINA